MFNPIHCFIFILLDISTFFESGGYSFFLEPRKSFPGFFLFTTYSQYIFVAPDNVRQAKKTVFKAIVI